MPESRQAGTIYDLGYQRYEGARHGRGYAFRRLVAYSFRAAFGLGRGGRSRLVPTVVLLIVFLPAIVTVGVASSIGMARFIQYNDYLEFTAVLLALFAAAQAPELLVTDRQHGVLSLYLSRPLRGADYALAKYVAFVLAMLALTLGPQIVLFLGKVFLPVEPWAALKAEWRKLLPILGGTLATSCFMAGIGLALSSLASRRPFATASVMGYFIFVPAAAAIFHGLATGDVKRYAVLAHPVWLMMGFGNWMFDVEARRRSTIGRADLPGEAYFYVLLGMTLLALGLLVWRYRKSES